MLTVKNKVSDRLKKRLQTEVGTPYYGKTLDFASTSKNAPTKLPCLNMVSLGEPQTANDLERKTQNAIISTIEIKCYTSTNYTEAFVLADRAGDIMISMGYELIAGIEDISDASANIALTRFRRIVGAGDVLY